MPSTWFPVWIFRGLTLERAPAQTRVQSETTGADRVSDNSRCEVTNDSKFSE
jgi:hypothetical protein